MFWLAYRMFIEWILIELLIDSSSWHVSSMVFCSHLVWLNTNDLYLLYGSDKSNNELTIMNVFTAFIK